MTKIPEYIRFWEKVGIIDRGSKLGECFEWQACKNNQGYGTFRPVKNGKLWLAHRYSYLTLIGNLEIGFVIDHLCRNPLCVRPEHLEQITQKENMWRALAKTHCKRGHAMQGTNLFYYPSGKRECRLCHNIRRMEEYYRQKER